MNPTLNFRWKPVQEVDPENCAAILPGHTDSRNFIHLDKYFILQQWWERPQSVIRQFPRERETDKGEWRNVPIDWSGKNDPPL